MKRQLSLLGATLLVAWACQRPAEEAPPATQAVGAREPAAAPAPGTPEWKIHSATSAAPPEIATGATVMDWASTPGGSMTELRKGTNNWTCMPDVPNTPGNDPMCLDPTFLAWAGAWQSKQTPQIKQVGIGYMLQGGTDASNTDPYATEPKPGEVWVKTGPHIMIVTPNVATLEGIPTDPSYGGPFVMWKGTPYAHVMVPVKSP